MQTRFLWTAAFVAAVGLAGCGGGGESGPLSRSESTQQVAQANRGVCDRLNAAGVTPGLHGLCVAYCEALNCPDATAGATALSSQCRAASPTVLANYNKTRKPSDPAMPCVKPPGCPCWSAGELAGVGRSFTPQNLVWFRNLFPGVYDSSALVENRIATDEFPYGGYTLAQMDDTATTDECRYFYADFAPNAPAPVIRVQAVTQPEIDSCKAEIEQQVQGLRADSIFVLCLGNNCGTP